MIIDSRNDGGVLKDFLNQKTSNRDLTFTKVDTKDRLTKVTLLFSTSNVNDVPITIPNETTLIHRLDEFFDFLVEFDQELKNYEEKTRTLFHFSRDNKSELEWFRIFS